MATPPARTEISDTYPNPTNAVARAGFGKLYDYVTGLLGSTGDAAEARAALGAPNIAGDTFLGLMKFKTGASIASAATVNLSTATGNTVHITGTTAISAITMTNGQVMDVVFDGILILTHNATTNKLPSEANITTSAGDTARYFYDGSVVYCLNYVKVNGKAVASVNVPVRQTVLSGPVDADGKSNFGGTAGTSTLTMSGTIRATAANGFDANGAVDRVGSGTNLQWTGLTVDGTMQLSVTVNADGSLTPVARSLLTNYRPAGADVTTDGQHTFNYLEMSGKVGNGTTANQAYEVAIGEVPVSGGVVSGAAKWYALQGKYYKLEAANTLFTSSFSHLIGCRPLIFAVNMYNYTSDLSYVPGDVIPASDAGASTGATKACNSWCNRISVGTSYLTSGLAVFDRSTSSYVSITNARWGLEYIVERGW